MSESFIYYEVLYDYEHSGNVNQDPCKFLKIRTGEIIEVDLSKNQNLSTNDWMIGRIQGMNEVGYFPATYVKEYNGSTRPLPRPRARHEFEGVYVKTPVFCSYCSDYIWGQGKVAVKCTCCTMVCHLSCEQFISSLCYKVKRGSQGENEVFTEPQDVGRWNKYEVAKWMAVVNLHRYCEIFSKHNIDGKTLLMLDEGKIQSMNIKDEFHINSILACVNSLKNPSRNMKLQDVTGNTTENHVWSVYSFTSMQSCHICGEVLYGIVQQGFQCQACGLCCHRKCSKYQLEPCDPHLMRNLRRPSFNSDSAFSRHLKSFHDVPIILVHCARSLESRTTRGCDLLTFYRKTPSTSEVTFLKNKFDQNISDISSLDLSSFDCPVVGGVLKKFLRDLPDPVIPEESYASFIDIDERNGRFLIESLDVMHQKTLNFLVAHFRKDSKPDNLHKLAKIFSQILMRPPWKQIIDIVDNVESQAKCIKLLLKLPDDIDIPPPVFPRPDPYDNSIKSALWYWEDLSREEVNEKMLNTTDGTYLVRNSIGKEDNAPYTLTLRKSSKNMLMKIYHSYGKYGLMDPLKFYSVQELIEHYTHNSLVEFNSNLNLTLQSPILRPIQRKPIVQDMKQLRQEFKIFCEKHKKVTENMENLHAEEERLTEELGMKQGAISAFKQVLIMYDEQLYFGTNFKPSIPSGDITKISAANVELMKKKLTGLEKIIQDIECEMSRVYKAMENIKTLLDENNSELKRLSDEKENRRQLLLQCGETAENIELLQQGQEAVSYETVPHFETSLWLIPDCDRIQAENFLCNREVGTFLVRPKEDGSYALSIMSPDKDRKGQSVVHCKIEKKESGFGFAEPFFIHKTLLDLVLHYKETSLIEHNDVLNVTLKWPVFHNVPL